MILKKETTLVVILEDDTTGYKIRPLGVGTRYNWMQTVEDTNGYKMTQLGYKMNIPTARGKEGRKLEAKVRQTNL